MFSRLPDKDVCPLLKSACIEGRCKFWTHVQGKHPQTGADVDRFDCAISWGPTLLIENASRVRQSSAAIESFRNEVVRGEPVLITIAERLGALCGMARRKQIAGDE